MAGVEADAEVTPETLKEKGLAKRSDPVKILARGEISKKLVVRVHAISATAREKIEAAGGTVELLREPKVRKKPKHHSKPAPAPEPEEPAAEVAAEEAPAEEAAADAEVTADAAEAPEAAEEP